MVKDIVSKHMRSRLEETFDELNDILANANHDIVDDIASVLSEYGIEDNDCKMLGRVEKILKDCSEQICDRVDELYRGALDRIIDTLGVKERNMRDDGVIDDKTAFSAMVVFWCGIGIILLIVLAYLFNG